MDDLTEDLGLQISYDDKCIKVIKRSQIMLEGYIWEVDRIIKSLEDLNSDPKLNALINKNDQVAESVSWFCMDMGWI